MKPDKGRMRLLVLLGLVVVASGCRYEPGTVPVPGKEGALKTSAKGRAVRRLYDGSPPVIPHKPMGADCTTCHTMEGIAVEGVGYAPPSPHAKTRGMSDISRCEQCHVWRQSDELFRENSFAGLAQDLRKGRRLYDGAPPVMPHKAFMRENCLACHSGPAAREEIRTPHPERPRCTQCHVEQRETAEFSRAGGG